MTSPSPIGQQANTALKDVLSEYVDEELATAEREDVSTVPSPPRLPQILTSSPQRPPAITVFPDMLYEGEFAERTDVAQFSMLDKPETSLKLPHCNPAATNITLHSVNLENSSNSVILIFRLSQLPDGLVDRILSPNDTDSTASIKYGMTARTVRWDSRNEVYMFNGRVGSPIYLTTSPNAQVLLTSKFTAMTDQRPYHGTAAQDVDVPVRTWKFKDGEDPDTNRFLQWMGKIEEVDPEEKPEEPEDGAGFRAHSSIAQPPQGRPRVPKVTAADDSDDESNDSDDESQKSAPTRSGNNIYNIFGLTASGGQVPTNNMTSSSSRIVLGRTGETPIIDSPPPFPVNAATVPSAIPACEPNSYTSSLVASDESEAVDRKSTGRSSSDHNSISTYSTGIPTYDRNHAVVDKIGLGGHAANRATWEHENVAPKKTTTNRSGIARRQMLTTMDSTQSLLATRTGSSAASTTSYVPPSASFQYMDDPLSPQKWTKKVTQPQSAGEKLIDFAGSVRGGQTTREPPGLKQFGRKRIPSHSPDYASNQAQDLDNVSSSRAVPSQLRTRQTTFQDRDLAASPRKKASMASPQTSIAGSRSMEARRTANDREFINERLYIAPDVAKLKRYTMGQKAPKRSKKPYKKPAPVKAVLEKPDPIPPAQSKKSKKEANTSNGAARPPTRSQAPNEPLGSLPNKAKEPSASSSPPMTAIEELLRSTISSNTLEGAVINASFGMILMRHTEPKDFLKGAINKEKLQTRLRAAGDSLRTSFFPRLTTSATDALFLLDMIPGSSVSATMEYEVLVKNAEGSIRIVRINQSDRCAVQVVCPDASLRTTYIHYPLRIWDAKVTVEAPGLDTSMADVATKFAASMQTTDEAPSFVAMLPPASFGIDKVYAKRSFYKTVADGVELKVVEVQELQLMSIDSDRYNVKATALSAADMINGQRLWWECGLSAQLVDDDSAATLQAVIDEMVIQMDGVGYGNKGPWEKEQVDVAAESVASPEPPFW